ncbi:MAG: AAA family ATPase [Clostridiales bacterium]|nr:AAA family ATPase [Clostridiales bacterium]
MSTYLNVPEPLELFAKQTSTDFYVDKTLMISDLMFHVSNFNYDSLCLTRPNGFGKSMMAQTVAAFFTKGQDSSAVFSKLNISKTKIFDYINSKNVFFIDMSHAVADALTCDDFLVNLCSAMLDDLHNAFPSTRNDFAGRYSNSPETGDRPHMSPQAALLMHKLVDALKASSEKFIFIVDEWDAPFGRPFMSEGYKLVYLHFLNHLFKEQRYIYFTYFTGMQPIPKTESSLLNNFEEFVLWKNAPFCTFFGFTESEVSDLHKRYKKLLESSGKFLKVSLLDLKRWYGGYKTPLGVSMYNPMSVMSALSNNSTSDFSALPGKTSQVLRI